MTGGPVVTGGPAGPAVGLPFVLVWHVAEGVLRARCACGAEHEAPGPVAVLDWLDEHPHRDRPGPRTAP